MTKILFINHSLSRECGIYSHGVKVFRILKNSKKYNFIYSECNNLTEFNKVIDSEKPEIVIYNYEFQVMSWAGNCKSIYNKITHIGLAHNITQENMKSYNLDPFNYRIALDPTLNETEGWFTSTRPLFNYCGKFINQKNDFLTIGSFGYYFRHKNFDKIILNAFNLNKKVKINLHINKAYFSSEDIKSEFDHFVNWAKSVTKNTNIDLSIISKHLSDEETIDELSKNDLNILLYDYNYGMGPSSAVDYCVAAGRPILLSNSFQFRHVIPRFPTIIDHTLDSAIDLGNSEVLKVRDEWSDDNFLKHYERIIYEVQNRKG